MPRTGIRHYRRYDAIAEDGKTEEGRGDLLVPFVPYARKFFLPQWVAFDENGDLLVKSVEEAEAHIKSMQRFMEVLFLAVALAPYFSADEEYTKKRYGMLGQLVNQGRALANYQTRQIIARIQERASSVGGTLSVESKPGAGTRLKFEIPLEDVENG
jgi:hypothetical protein